ncbi:MAG: DegT/DnrJ/EryC1/StrS family aminotransferase [Methanosarcina barkeri]|nr:DegT/DnrJ/EryC1/StrS family aminotransferase [Methanosarcina sp. ERenArc_MAG2]
MIPLMKNAFYNEKETKDALSKFILETPRLSMDQKCFEFEDKFARFQERKYAILFNSGGSANLALLQSLKNLRYLKNGDNVGFSALTWSTNVMPIIQLGLKPIPLDCELRTLNISSNTFEKRINSVELKVLFITNTLGFAGDLDKIREICGERKIILIEDNCESLGSELPTGKTGNFGLASTFSFYIAHHMSTIEGGMICTDDHELSQMLRIVRANGWDRNLQPDQQSLLRKNTILIVSLMQNTLFMT